MSKTNIQLGEVERQLSRQMRAFKEPDDELVHRAHMSNLVIFCNRETHAQELAATLPTVAAIHPARVLLLIGEPGPDGGDPVASVNVWCQTASGRQKYCSEQVTLHARGSAVDRLPYAVRSLLIGDLPTNVWWAAPQPPPLAGALLFDLAERAQQIIYDSYAWPEPARGVAATAEWLPRFERGSDLRQWRVASDLNWRRLKFWRRTLGQALDPATAPGALESVTNVLVEHGPHAVIQAWELVSWLASRLGWRVEKGRVQPGVEIAWQFHGPHGPVRVHVRRLPEGPSEVRCVMVSCTIQGQPALMHLTIEEERRIAITLQGLDVAARTVTIQPQPLADLVARQLSDRERDPVFTESMAVARVLAESLLH